ncbi:unnamed protein product [Rhizophagus irregularis]|nr:unnamed protein product [Rhizophagus irregularis]
MLKTKKSVHNNRNQKEVSIHSSPKTPPNRVYTGKGIEEENDEELQKSPIELKRDNVSLKEVVDIINEYREGKIEDIDFAYTQYDFPTTKEHTAKLDIKIQHPMKKFGTKFWLKLLVRWPWRIRLKKKFCVDGS